MLEMIKESLSKNKLLAIFPVLALAMVIPAIMLGITSPQELRSQAAYTACATTAPCIGTIKRTVSGTLNLVAKDNSSYIIKSITIDLTKYLNKYVSVIGNLVPKTTTNPAVIYATSVKEIPQTTSPQNSIVGSSVAYIDTAGRYHVKLEFNTTPLPTLVMGGETAGNVIKIIGTGTSSTPAASAFTGSCTSRLPTGGLVYCSNKLVQGLDWIFNQGASGVKYLWAVFHNDASHTASSYWGIPTSSWSKPVSIAVNLTNVIPTPQFSKLPYPTPTAPLKTYMPYPTPISTWAPYPTPAPTWIPSTPTPTWAPNPTPIPTPGGTECVYDIDCAGFSPWCDNGYCR